MSTTSENDTCFWERLEKSICFNDSDQKFSRTVSGKQGSENVPRLLVLSTKGFCESRKVCGNQFSN